MNIVYSCNDFYIPQTGISIISLCENNKEAEEITIYFIGKDVSEKNIKTLREITEKYNRKFVYIDFESIAYDLKISAIGRHIETIYAKVFFSRINDLNKIIYLDSDIIINGSLLPLWNEELEDCYLGAVQTFCTEKSQLGIDEVTPFFNDGMAIINVDYCRKNNLIEKVFNVLDEYNGNPPVLSEGVLNKVCQGHVKFISLKWNCMAGILYHARLNLKTVVQILNQYTGEDIEQSVNEPVVIHYLSSFYNRPWFEPCTHPYRECYYKYKAMSPWKELKPKHNPLPFKIRVMDYTYRIFGYKCVLWFRKVKKQILNK